MKAWAFVVGLSLLAAGQLHGRQQPQLTDDEQAAIETRASEIFNTVMSPFCPGRLISTCPSPAAAVLRDEIRGQLAAGASAGDIKDALYETYGEELRSAPEAKGFGLVAWLIPGAFFLIAAGFLTRWLRTTTLALAASEPVDPDDLDPESAALLDEELSKVE